MPKRKATHLSILAVIGLFLSSQAHAMIIDSFDGDASDYMAWGGGTWGYPDVYTYQTEGQLGNDPPMEGVGGNRHAFGFIDDYVDPSDMWMRMGTRWVDGGTRGVWEQVDYSYLDPASYDPWTGFTTIWWDAGRNSADNWNPEWPFDGRSTDWGGTQTVGSTTGKIIDWDHSEPSSGHYTQSWDVTVGPVSTFEGFEIDAWHNQTNGNQSLTLEVWTLDGNTDSVTIDWADSTNYVTYQIGYTEFTGLTLDDFKNVGAIRLQLDSDTTGFHGRIDEVRTTGVPEPGTMALLGTLGAVGAAMRRRKKKQDPAADTETPPTPVS